VSLDHTSTESPEELLQRVCGELEQRLRSGEPCRAETFFFANPTLASDPNLALDLIVKEYVVRQELGQGPDPEEWVRRFPQWEERLRRQFAVLSLFAGSVRESSTVPDKAGPAPAEQTEEPAPELGRHELLEEIGNGTMGTVYRARDTVLNREVALKKIRADGPVSSKLTQRFYREARVIAQLRHPNIVPIYGMGLHEGQHCFTMPLVPGGSLAQHKARYYDDLRAAAALVEKIARAVAAAHARGIVHRDLKPANVLLDENGEPLVADFGLAKAPDGNADLTSFGLLGTPAYMAPEQAAGHAWRVTAASDVWALGIILYELTTGQRPFVGQSAAEVTEQVLTGDPAPPRKLRAGMDVELEAFILKCLAKEPAERYPSAGALADDLEHWLRGEPTRVRPLPWYGQVWRGVKRRPVQFVVAAALLALLLAIAYKVSFPEPDVRTWKEVERLLEAGEEVELLSPLLSPSGLPPWSKWRVGKGSLAPSSDGDGSFVASTREVALVEVLADPKWESYSFTVTVRQELASTGEVGLYFFHHADAAGEGAVDHSFCAWTFADEGLQAGKTACNFFRLHEPFLRKQVRSREAPFPVVKHSWHTLSVEVRPTGTRLFFDGAPAHELTGSELVRGAKALQADELFPALTPPPLSRRGGLGLYLSQTTASFQHVTFKALQ
jgi:serine/threonine-protein kinase